MKLQLYIYKSRHGEFVSLRAINQSDEVQRFIRDERFALALPDYDPASRHVFYLVRYIPIGTLFTIMRTIPDQPLDHLAATIFVPREIVISARDMEEVVRTTTQIVSNQAVTTEEMERLHRLLQKEYAVDSDAPVFLPSEGNGYAFCLYGNYAGLSPLSNFLGDNLYRPAFVPYSGVLLVDANIAECAGGDNLTASSPEQTVVLFPPEPNHEGFTPHIFHRIFDRPFAVVLGSTVEVDWKRGGFESVVQYIEVTSPGMRATGEDVATSHKAISPASFIVTGQGETQPLPDATITVNGCEINQAHSFTPGELENAEVSVEAPGHIPFHGHVDLGAAAQAHVSLKEPQKVYRFELPVRSAELGAPVKFEIRTKRDLTESPIEGYDLLDAIQEGPVKVNYLQFAPSAGGPINLRTTILSAAVALVVGFVIGWLIPAGSDSEGPVESVEFTGIDTVAVHSSAGRRSAAPKAAPPAVKAASKAAIEYLDSNNAWVREEMEAIPDLKGLFDDMNNYRFSELVERWGPKLKNSTNFARVVHHAREARRRSPEVMPTGTYCRSGDTRIAWLNYTYKINP